MPRLHWSEIESQYHFDEIALETENEIHSYALVGETHEAGVHFAQNRILPDGSDEETRKHAEETLIRTIGELRALATTLPAIIRVLEGAFSSISGEVPEEN